MQQRIKPKLTWRLVKYMLIDCLGLALFSIGLASLMSGGPVLIPNFPSNKIEAVTVMLAGIVIAIYAVGQVMREMASQRPQPPENGAGT